VSRADTRVEADDDRETRLREDPSSWWYGGGETPLWPDTLVVRPSVDAYHHLVGCSELSDPRERETTLNRHQLRSLPPAHRDECPECWPEPGDDRERQSAEGEQEEDSDDGQQWTLDDIAPESEL